MPVSVRLSEWERYDINRDRDVIRFIATTDKGSYHTEIPVDRAGGLRRAREQFKKEVENCIQQGIAPCELELDVG